MMRHLQRLLGHNAELQTAFNWATADVAGPVSALVLATMIFLIGAALLFTFKEYIPRSKCRSNEIWSGLGACFDF